MKYNIDAIIPVRFGSKRIKGKSIRLLNGRPLIQYCIDNIKPIKLFNNISINSDHHIYHDIAKLNGIQFYKRKQELATSESLIDDYIYDYFVNNNSDYLAIINPTSPFMKTKYYEEAINLYFNQKYDTLLSCEKIQTHCFFEGKSINFSINQQHPRSQDLNPILALNFAITILNKNVFAQNYESKGFGLYSGKIGFYVTSGDANVDIDYEEDFQFAESLSRIRKENETYSKEYHSLFSDYINKNTSN